MVVGLNFARGDADHARPLYEELAGRFGAENILIDRPDAIDGCDALLVVIGPRWQPPDLQSSGRQELEIALASDVRVLPVLVGGGVMPRRDELPLALGGLAHRNALELREHALAADMRTLLSVLERLPSRPVRVAEPRANVLLDEILVPGEGSPRRIQLWAGNLTSLLPEEAVDVLVVSAFPNDYVPLPGTLIAALAGKGVQVEELARSKAVDLRDTCSCWLSEPIHSADPGIQFRQVLCFEPFRRGDPTEIVGDIFRSLIPFVGATGVRRVAMPLPSTGSAGVSYDEMLPALLAAAVHWLSVGAPLELLKIFVRPGAYAEAVASLFAREKQRLQVSTGVTSSAPATHDVFVSYARENESAVDLLARELERLDPSVNVYVDRHEIEPGMAWLESIYGALAACRRVVAVYSPEYVTSKMCQDEFNTALFRSLDTDANLLFPLYLYTAALPPHMAMRQFVDCREGDEQRLRDACARLLESL